jgi:hypothetical protein
MLNLQDCVLNIILGTRIGKERVFNQHHHIFLLNHQCQFYMLYIPLMFILSHHGGGVIHGHILFHISDHIMFEYATPRRHVRDNHISKMTVVSIKISLEFRIRKRLSSKFIE